MRLDLPTRVAPTPALELAQQRGDLYRQLGAVDVTTTDPATVHVAYDDLAAAAHAKALLADTVRGVHVVVDDRSTAGGVVQLTPDGFASALRGVEGLHVNLTYAKSGGALISAGAHDGQLIADLVELIRPKPAPGVAVSFWYSQAAQDGS